MKMCVMNQAKTVKKKEKLEKSEAESKVKIQKSKKGHQQQPELPLRETHGGQAEQMQESTRLSSL